MGFKIQFDFGNVVHWTLQRSKPFFQNISIFLLAQPSVSLRFCCHLFAHSIRALIVHRVDCSSLVRSGAGAAADRAKRQREFAAEKRAQSHRTAPGRAGGQRESGRGALLRGLRALGVCWECVARRCGCNEGWRVGCCQLKLWFFRRFYCNMEHRQLQEVTIKINWNLF